MKNRRLLLLALGWTRPKDPPMSLGHASILANLNQYNINVLSKSWSVNRSNFSYRDVSSYILDNSDGKTDIALGAFVWNEKATKNIIKDLRKNSFSGNIILGGPQISYVKGKLESYYPDVDIFIRGYGEEALASLYMSNDTKPLITGVSYKGVPDLGISANVDLNKIPSPYLSGLIKPQSFIRWETQRGCPFRCSFCQHRESDVSMTRRNIPINRVLSEAEWITDNPIINDVAVLDPTFNSGPNYLEVLDKLIDGKYSGKLSLQCRLEMVKQEFLDKIEELNKTANVVLEFGIQTIHKNEWSVIQRPNNIGKAISVLSETKRRGIETEISLIFGLPNQTVESFQQSIDFCKDMEVSRIYAFPLMLLRGTPLHAKKKELGLVESSDVNIPQIDRIQDDIPHVVASPSFGFLQWQKMSKMAQDLEEYNKNIPKGTWIERVGVLGRKTATKLSL